MYEIRFVCHPQQQHHPDSSHCYILYAQTIQCLSDTHRNTRRLYYFASRWVRLSAVTSLYPPCSLADKPKTKKNTLICLIMSLRSGKSCTQKHACPRLSNSRLPFLFLWTVSHALVSSLKPVNRLVLAPCTRTCRFTHPIGWKKNVNLPFLFYRRYSKEDNSPS